MRGLVYRSKWPEHEADKQFLCSAKVKKCVKLHLHKSVCENGVGLVYCRSSYLDGSDKLCLRSGIYIQSYFKGASSSVHDVDHYVLIRKLLQGGF
jgi:hypothetical protein